jgi:ABC-2 type transport system ATP-binding protein
VKTFSGGMRRKVDLAMSLVGRPKVLFLDEPTTGLDPRSRQAVWDVVGELVGSGVTIFLTTQYLEEADQLADRISVLDGGRVVATGSADELKRRIGAEQVELALADRAGVEQARGLLGPGVVVAGAGRGGAGVPAAAGAEPVVRVPTDGSADHLRYVLDTLAAGGVAVSTATVRRPTLDDVFLTLTGTRELEGASR